MRRHQCQCHRRRRHQQLPRRQRRRPWRRLRQPFLRHPLRQLSCARCTEARAGRTSEGRRVGRSNAREGWSRDAHWPLYCSLWRSTACAGPIRTWSRSTWVDASARSGAHHSARRWVTTVPCWGPKRAVSSSSRRCPWWCRCPRTACRSRRWRCDWRSVRRRRGSFDWRCCRCGHCSHRRRRRLPRRQQRRLQRRRRVGAEPVAAAAARATFVALVL